MTTYIINVDKNPSSNPSSERKQIIIQTEELRRKTDIYDSIVITKDENYIMRRLAYDPTYQSLTVLDPPVKQPLADIPIELFEGDNYIYLTNATGNIIYAEYLIDNEFNDLYVIHSEMESAITQTAEMIELHVSQTLQDYSTTTQVESLIQQKADSILLEVVGVNKYSSSSIYYEGDYCTYNDVLYQCNTDISTPEPWTPAHWTVTNITDSKVDVDDYTRAQIVLKINSGGSSEAKINAAQVNITAADVINLLAGNTINLTSKNIVIDSTNFKVSATGAVTASNMNITGGRLTITKTTTDAAPIVLTETDGSYSYVTEIRGSTIGLAYYYNGQSVIRI